MGGFTFNPGHTFCRQPTQNLRRRKLILSACLLSLLLVRPFLYRHWSLLLRDVCWRLAEISSLVVWTTTGFLDYWMVDNHCWTRLDNSNKSHIYEHTHTHLFCSSRESWLIQMPKQIIKTYKIKLLIGALLSFQRVNSWQSWWGHDIRQVDTWLEQ